MKTEQAGVWKVSLVQKYFSHQVSREKIHHVLEISLAIRGVGSAIHPLKGQKDIMPEGVLGKL